MTSKEHKNTGDKLKENDDDIQDLKRLLSIMTGEGFERIYGAGKEFREDFVKKLKDTVEELMNDRISIINSDPAPDMIICPHCGYDGEFGVEKPEHEGFRTLQPILEPRMVLSYDGAKLSLSDTDESHDQFDSISEPSHYDFMDAPGNGSTDYVEMRKCLRGKWLLCCGKCFEYFSMKDFMGRVQLDYPGGRPWDTKWRKRG